MRIVRIATLVGDTPQAIDVGMMSPGKVVIQNTGAGDIAIGQDRSDVLIATGVNFLTLPAGVMLVFDCGPEIGFLGQRQMWWFNAIGVNTSLEVAIFSESH
jgi:hypothetical protein